MPIVVVTWQHNLEIADACGVPREEFSFLLYGIHTRPWNGIIP